MSRLVRKPASRAVGRAPRTPGAAQPVNAGSSRASVGLRLLPPALGLILAIAALGTPAGARVYLGRDEALGLAFGDPARAERKTAYLTDEQAAAIEEAAGSPAGSRVVVYFEGTDAAGEERTAWFDTHLVRTLPETVMVVVGAGGRVVRVDILSFDEPEDYLPSRRWLDQFDGRPLDEELSTRRAIRAVAGATLSSRAVTATVRRVLATHHLLTAPSPAPGSAGPQRVEPEGEKP